MPAISVIVPAYNCEEYIGAALGSVVAQDFGDWELIVVDDGSTDGTAAGIDAMAAGDARVRRVRKANGGVSSARNAGLDEARGNYIVFLDADDELAPGALSLFATEASSGADVVVASAQVVDGRGNVTSEVRLPASWQGQRPAAERVEEMGIAEKAPLLHYIWGRAYRADALRKGELRFDEGISLGEDFIFNCDVLARGGDVRVADGFTYRYARRGTPSLSNGFRRGELNRRRLMDGALHRLLAGFGLYERKKAFYEQCVGAIALTSAEAVGSAGKGTGDAELGAYLNEFYGSEYRGYIAAYADGGSCGGPDRVLAKMFLAGMFGPFICLCKIRQGLRNR